MRALLDLVTTLLRRTLTFFESHDEQAIVELALRQQLATYTHWRRRDPACVPRTQVTAPGAPR